LCSRQDHDIPTRKDKFSVLSTACDQLRAWFASKDGAPAAPAALAPDNSGKVLADFTAATFRRLFMDADLAMAILSVEGVVLYCNKSFAELFGLNAASLPSRLVHLDATAKPSNKRKAVPKVRSGASAGTSSKDGSDKGADDEDVGISILDLLHHDSSTARDFILHLGAGEDTAGRASSVDGKRVARPTVKVRSTFKTLHGELPVRMSDCRAMMRLWCGAGSNHPVWVGVPSWIWCSLVLRYRIRTCTRRCCPSQILPLHRCLAVSSARRIPLEP
jgi:hypothetical protein